MLCACKPLFYPGPVKNWRTPLRGQDLNLDFQIFCPYFFLARAGFSHWFRDLGAQAGKVEQSHVHAKLGFRADFGGGGSWGHSHLYGILGFTHGAHPH